MEGTMEENQREEGSVSLKDIFSVIFSQKWIALIILIAVTVAGTAGIYFGSNVKDKTYKVSFVLTLPGSDEYSVNYQYPDGTAFRYSDMVSLSTLKKVKESSEDFSSIDVDAMAKKGDILISREISETKTSAGNSTFESTYTISAKARCFKSFDVARMFMQALAYTPGYYLSQMKIDYSYTTIAENASDYVSTVTVLKQQLDDLLEHYEDLIESYGNNFVVDGEKTLQSYMRNLSTYIETNSELDNLITRANIGGYLKNESCISDFESRLKQAEKDLQDAQTTLNKMLSGTASDQPSSLTAIQTQSDLVNEFTRKVEYLKNYLANAKFENGTDSSSQDYTDYSNAKAAYEKDLNAGIASVGRFTDELQKVTSTVYKKLEAVSFTSTNIISIVGGRSIIWSFAVSLVAGLVLSFIIAYAVGAAKLTKSRKLKAQQTVAADAQPFETEVVAQAAVTDAEDNKKDKKSAEKDEK